MLWKIRKPCTMQITQPIIKIQDTYITYGVESPKTSLRSRGSLTPFKIHAAKRFKPTSFRFKYSLYVTKVQLNI